MGGWHSGSSRDDSPATALLQAAGASMSTNGAATIATGQGGPEHTSSTTERRRRPAPRTPISERGGLSRLPHRQVLNDPAQGGFARLGRTSPFAWRGVNRLRRHVSLGRGSASRRPAADERRREGSLAAQVHLDRLSVCRGCCTRRSGLGRGPCRGARRPAHRPSSPVGAGAGDGGGAAAAAVIPGDTAMATVPPCAP